MRVLLLPNDLSFAGKCGVVDYTSRLKQELIKNNVVVDTLDIQNWSIKSIFRGLKEINKKKLDIIHFQYPSLPYLKSLCLFFLLYYACFIKRIAIIYTAHEFINMHILAKIANFSILIIAKHIIFTNEIERKKVKKWLPFINKKSSVIPLGSAINTSPYFLEKRDCNSVVYFGIFRPDKGIEQFIDFANFVKQNNCGFKFILVGAVTDEFLEYYHGLRNSSKECDNVSWHINCSEEEIIDILGKNLFAMFPYKDGASERRSSLCAAFQAGMIIISTIGENTTNDLAKTIEIFKNNESTLNFLNKVSLSVERQQKLIQRSLDYAKKISWDYIADKHMQVYGKIILK